MVMPTGKADVNCNVSESGDETWKLMSGVCEMIEHSEAKQNFEMCLQTPNKTIPIRKSMTMQT